MPLAAAMPALRAGPAPWSGAGTTRQQCQADCPAGLIVDFEPGATDYKARLSTHTETTTNLYRFGAKPRPLLTRSIVGAAA